MTTLRIELSDSHSEKLNELAVRENITPSELAAKIVREAISQAEFFDQRATRGSREKFLEAMSKVPNDPPVPPDTPYHAAAKDQG
ncbi:MAG: hypothetical protein WD872_00535 [Pirellulaceae bacterium]